MSLSKSHWFLVIANLAYLIPFTIYYVRIGNFEFLWYVIILGGFFALILATISKTKFTLPILLGLSVWSFLHMAGGGIRIGEDVLYSLVLIPVWELGDNVILKYDQLVHAFGFFVSTLVVYHLLKPNLLHVPTKGIVFVIAACAGMGMGALNEIVEFVAVVLVPETNVGGYYNTAIDLVFNMLGAILAATLLYTRLNLSPISSHK